MNDNQTGARPLLPGIDTGNADIRLRPFVCPECGVTQYAHDFEELPDGFRLVCKCGADLVSIIIREELPDASDS